MLTSLRLRHDIVILPSYSPQLNAIDYRFNALDKRKVVLGRAQGSEEGKEQRSRVSADRDVMHCTLCPLTGTNHH